jgi:hypothetical protein
MCNQGKRSQFIHWGKVFGTRMARIIREYPFRDSPASHSSAKDSPDNYSPVSIPMPHSIGCVNFTHSRPYFLVASSLGQGQSSLEAQSNQEFPHRSPKIGLPSVLPALQGFSEGGSNPVAPSQTSVTPPIAPPSVLPALQSFSEGGSNPVALSQTCPETLTMMLVNRLETCHIVFGPARPSTRAGAGRGGKYDL